MNENENVNKFGITDTFCSEKPYILIYILIQNYYFDFQNLKDFKNSSLVYHKSSGRSR